MLILVLKRFKKLLSLWLQNQGRISLLYVVLKIEINMTRHWIFKLLWSIWPHVVFFSDDKAKRKLKEFIKRVNIKGKGIMRRWLGIMVGTGGQNYRGTKSRPNVSIARIVSNRFPCASLLNLEQPSVGIPAALCSDALTKLAPLKSFRWLFRLIRNYYPPWWVQSKIRGHKVAINFPQKILQRGRFVFILKFSDDLFNF